MGPSRQRGQERGRGRGAGAGTRRSRERGQAHTVEAVIAALLLLTSVSFALQVTAVTPLSASTSNQHIENQQQSVAEGLLSVTRDDGSLEDALLYWESNALEPEFHCATNEEGYGSGTDSPCPAPAQYDNHTPPNEFGRALDRAFGPGVAVNVLLSYENASGVVETQPLIFRGQPTDNAVRATTTVVLHDDDELLDPSGTPTGVEVSDTNKFYAPPAPSADEPESTVYSVVRVEVIVWRI